MENYFKTFHEGDIYEMHFITDYDLRPKYICIKRTAKTATFERFMSPGKPMTRRIKTDSSGHEYIVKGTYSMAPSINSRNVVG